MSSRIPPETADRARAMRANGATYAEIREAFGIGSSTTVSRILGIAGTGRSHGPRPRVSAKTRESARELRRLGKTVPQIAGELGIARSTAWSITKDIGRKPGLSTSARRSDAARRKWEMHNQERARARETVRAAAVDQVGELSERELLLIGTAFYWAEGSKAKPWRPNDERLRFINSDPDVVRVYLAWLDLLGVSRDRVTARVSIHESADVAAANTYWAEVVGVPVESMARPSLKRHNPKTVRKNTGDSYHGCAVIEVRASAPEYWRMHGLWSAISEQARPP